MCVLVQGVLVVARCQIVTILPLIQARYHYFVFSVSFCDHMSVVVCVFVRYDKLKLIVIYVTGPAITGHGGHTKFANFSNFHHSSLFIPSRYGHTIYCSTTK